MSMNPEYLITSIFPEEYELLERGLQISFIANILPFFEFIEMMHNEKWAPDVFINNYTHKSATVAAEFALSRGITSKSLMSAFQDVFLTTYPPIYNYIATDDFFTSSLSFVEGNHYAIVIEKSPSEFRLRRKRTFQQSQRP